MPPSILSPFDIIKPSQFLSQYSEWVYFSLILVFFISIAGITLRHYFDNPYVKPLIISVGLMLTAGVFMIKDRIAIIFESWGTLGTVLLVLIAAIVPYGLCTGFGMKAGKAFHVTYILFYVLSWIKFPQLYHALADRNLGLINLALLIFFAFSVFKLFSFRRSAGAIEHDLVNRSPYRHQIEDEIGSEDKEERLVKKQGRKRTTIETDSMEDIASELAGIQRIVDKSSNNLSLEDRRKMTRLLEQMKAKEDIFRNQTNTLQRLFQKMKVMDVKQLQELKQRIVNASGKEKHILKSELEREDEKIRIEETGRTIQSRLDQYLSSFNQHIGSAIKKINENSPPSAAKPHLYNARIILNDMFRMLKDMKFMESKLIDLIKTEKHLLKKERNIA